LSDIREALRQHIAIITSLVLFSCMLPSIIWCAPLEKVRLQLKWYHQFQFAGYYAAQAKGFYHDEGLDVELIEGSKDISPYKVVLDQKADFGVQDGGDLVYRRLNGEPLIAVATIFQHSPQVLLSKKSCGIRHPSDLVGRTVMISQDRGAAQILAMLLREGVKVKSFYDQEPVRFKPLSWNVDDLAEGRVDAMQGYLTSEMLLLKKLHGIEPAVLDPLEYGIDFYGDTLFTSGEISRKHPDTVARFRRASLKGWEYAMAQQAEVVDMILALPTKRQKRPDRETLLGEAGVMNNIVLPKLVEMGNMNPGRWGRMAQIYHELGMVTSASELKGFMYEADAEKQQLNKYIRVLGIILGCLGLLAAAAFFWVRTLRSQVNQRTEQLTAANEELRLAIETSQRAEEALREKTSIAQTFMDALPCVALLLRTETREIVALNRAASEAGARLGATCFGSWPKSDSPCPFCRAPQGWKTGTPQTVEVEALGVSWEAHWVPISEDLYLHYAFDVTERKHAEEKERRIQEATERLAGEIAVIAEIGRVIGSTLDIDEVYDRFADETQKLISFDNLIITLINEEEKELVIAYVSGMDIPSRRKGDRIPYKGSIAEMISISGQGIILQSENIEEGIKKYPGQIHMYRADLLSVLFAPLISEGKIFGGLVFRSKKPNAYTEQDLRLAERVGMQISGAIANALMFSKFKQGEEKLANAMKHLTAHMDNSPLAVIEFDSQFRVTRWSKEAERVFGWASEEIEGRSISEMRWVHEEDEELVRDESAGLLGGERPRSLNVNRNYRKDGSVLYCEWYNSGIYDSHGKLISVLSLVLDITNRKRTEEVLRASEERHRTMLKTAMDGIWCVDLQGRLLEVNDAYCRMSGYSAQELLAMSIPDLESVETIDDTAAHIRKIVAKGEDRFESRHRRKDGRIFDIEASVQYRPTDGGQLAVFLRDITERKHLEKERKELEERLHRAEKMEALGQLAGGVAHDLNNILGVSTIYSELLNERIPQGNPLRSYVDSILSSNQKAAAIVQDLLTLARRNVTVSEVMNLNSVVGNFLKTPEFEKIQAFHPNATFRTELDGGLMNIKGSPVHVEKTLMNLALNAAEAIQGKGEVIIRTQSRYLDKAVRGYDEVKEGEYAVLSVSDTGMGIPLENRERIFEPFFTKKTMGRSGTGLGLAIVWGTVKDHNGYIDLQTEVGVGTTFALYFPATRDELISQPQQAPIERYLGNGESVLVVDDAVEQRDIAVRILTRLGYRVHAVSGGEEAVERLKTHKADLLVLDMIMDPGIDGLETYKRVLEVSPKQRAIIVSGFSETERVKAAQDLGAGAYVRKPYNMEKIGVAVRDELRKGDSNGKNSDH
jgi:PAS domain S-box-containing protein